MSSRDGADQTSEVSGSDTSSMLVTNSRAPVLEETLFQPQLFYAFLKFLAAHRAQENLVFLKHASLYALLNRPPKEMYYMAMRIVWMFLCENSPNAVNVSSETFKKMAPVVWSKQGSSLVSPDMFNDAYNEVKLMLNSMYSTWISTGEWASLPFFRSQAPTIPVILKLPKVSSHFESFLKARMEQTSPKISSAEMDYKIFKALCELNAIVAESKQPEASKKEVERKARRYIRTNKAELLALPNMDEIELPQNLHHHKKKGQNEDESVEDDEITSGISCLDFAVEAVDVLVEELSERECYEAFSESRSWDPVEVLRASLQQSKDAEGYVEYPTLAGALLSPTLGPLLMNQFKDSDKFQEMRYLLETYDYFSRFRTTLERKHNSQERKEMHTEAKRLFDKFIQFNTIALPQKMRNELTVAILSFAGFKITPTVFQRSGAWIYNRIEKSWFREVCTLLLWVDHDFDNHSEKATEMSQLFDMDNVGDFSLKLVPHPDDIIGNRDLWECFRRYVPSNGFNSSCMQFARDFMSLEHASQETICAEVESLISQLKAIGKDLPELNEITTELEQNAVDPRDFNPSVLAMPYHMIMKVLMEQYYPSWVKRCKIFYRKISWTPVKLMTFIGSDAIADTSCIPSVGIAATITSRAPTKERKHLFSGFGKPRSGSTAGASITPSNSSTMLASSSYSPGTKRASFSPVIGRSPTGSSSSDTLMSKPVEAVASDDEDGVNPRHLPNSVPKSYPKFMLEVPTFPETFASTHLRRLFYGSFLEMRLGDEEKKLWNVLCKFHADFACLTDAEVTSRQSDIIDAAMNVLDQFPQLPGHDEMVTSLKEKRYTVSSRFFFDAEAKLYGQFHANYQSFLSNNKWVTH